MGPRDGVPMFAPRIYVGRDPDKNAMVNLSDKNGKLRIRMMVDSLNRGFQSRSKISASIESLYAETHADISCDDTLSETE